MKKIIEFFISRGIFINLLSAIFLIVGGYYMTSMNREAFPNIDFDIVTVTTIFPGASSSEVEKLITIPLEDELKGLAGIDKMTSTSLENRSAIAIWVDPDEEDYQKVLDDVRSAVDRTRPELPEDAENPLITEITSSRQPVIEIALAAKEKNGKPLISEMELRDYAYRLERRILDMEEVATVARRGWRDREMIVELDPIKMQRYYVSSNQVVTALETKNINLPGGKLKTRKEEYIVRTLGEVEKVDEIRKVYVRANDLGEFVRIEDIASVTDGFDEREYIEKTNGLQSISLTVVKKEKADIISTVDKALDLVNKFKGKLPPTIEVFDANDISFFVRRRLNVLVNNALVGIVLIIGSLFLFLSWRIGIVVVMGMITAMAASFVYLGYTGISLNLLTMFALVMVIGMVVDDAIIVAENIYRHMEKGISPYQAAIEGATEVIAPVTATIITTVSAFAPLMFMSGIFGKFVYFIPLVIIVTLIASLLESFIILPSHVFDFSKNEKMKRNEANEASEKGLFRFIRDKLYLPSLSWALRHRILTFVIMTLVFIGAAFTLRTFGSFKLFPGAIDIFQIKFEAPRGYSLEQSNEVAQIIEKAVSKLPKEELDDYLTRVGIISKSVNDPNTQRGSNYGQILIYLTPEASRERSAEEIIAQIRRETIWLAKIAQIKNESKKPEPTKDLENKEEKSKEELLEEKKREEYLASRDFISNKKLAYILPKLEYEKVQGGPPVGKAVSVEIRGREFKTMQKIGQRIKEGLATIPGAVDIGDDMGEGKSEILVHVDERKASYAGVSVFSIASAIRTAFEGTVASSIRNTEEEIEVRVRFPENYRRSLANLNNVYVSNNEGQLIPITQLTSFKKETGILYINHLDNERVLRVQSNVNENITTSAAVNAKLQEMFKDIENDYPGYTVRYGGENEDTQESLESLARAFIIAILIIFLILASLFRSLLQPITVMAAIPFAFIGVITAFVTHGEPFSFMALMGVVGLSGVVVNDSIVLVDFANKILEDNPDMPIREVAKEAGKLRLRAVILTTVTTVLGLLPTAYGIGGNDPFLVPAALAFSWGLGFSTVITLILVPILYTAVYDLKRKTHKYLSFIYRKKEKAAG